MIPLGIHLAVLGSRSVIKFHKNYVIYGIYSHNNVSYNDQHISQSYTSYQEYYKKLGIGNAKELERSYTSPVAGPNSIRLYTISLMNESVMPPGTLVDLPKERM